MAKNAQRQITGLFPCFSVVQEMCPWTCTFPPIADYGSFPPAVRAVLTQRERMRTLEIHGPLSFEDLDGLLSAPAPRMESLVIRSSQASLAERYGLRMPLLLSGKCPHLSSLSISFFMDYGENSFRGLRQLHLAHQCYQSFPDLLALYNFLQDIPELEDLAFDCLEVDPDFENLMDDNEHRISLPRLRKVAFIKTAAWHANYILTAFTFRAKQQVAITIDSQFLEDHEYIDVILDNYPHSQTFCDARRTHLQYGQTLVDNKEHLTVSVSVYGSGGALQFLNFLIDWHESLGESCPPLRKAGGITWITNHHSPGGLFGEVLEVVSGSTEVLIDDAKLSPGLLLTADHCNLWPPPHLTKQDRKLWHIILRIRGDREQLQDILSKLEWAFDDLVEHPEKPMARPITYHLYPDDQTEPSLWDLCLWRRHVTDGQYSSCVEDVDIHLDEPFPTFASTLPGICTVESSGDWEWPRWGGETES